MGASPNPFAALSAMLAAKSPGGAGTGATGTGSSDSAVGNASTQLQGADPKYALKELMGVKQTIANYITSLAFRVPAASRALSSTLKGIRELCNGYGKAVTASWYDFESPEGEKFMAKKGIHQHLPLVIWIAGKPVLKINGKEVQFVGFPTGSGPPSFQGDWNMDDLRGELDRVTGKKK